MMMMMMIVRVVVMFVCDVDLVVTGSVSIDVPVMGMFVDCVEVERVTVMVMVSVVNVCNGRTAPPPRMICFCGFLSFSSIIIVRKTCDICHRYDTFTWM